MQIFNSKKKKIGTLSGFRGRTITTTLSSGDKELTFEYPADGKMVSQLSEECYIRTKTDEFVLKAIENGKQFNKYTAVINVEELEGTSFPYGFESQEQTIRKCLEFAFEGTGWTVGTCTVTKKRTINEEGSLNAWDVLQECLRTYRCECIIDTINKAINIYEQIGSDKGCYFIDGLNLRKLTLKSDTYEFYTRIYPIGKDGITPYPVLGKDYIDNFQYSSKIKAYVWKDERYTNTTSLIEDAEAKLAEFSKPYKAFSADVVDLAKANPEYTNILDYGIGDTVMMVSKHPKMREKQRIVKIVEYPETPENNMVELSNTTKTFAEVQKTETESAREEAISISNRTTKKILDNYSTKEEVETKITASKEQVELGVSSTLENYYDKKKTDAIMRAAKGEIELSVSEGYQTKEAMGEYLKTEETKALVDVVASAVEIKVSKGDVSNQLSVETEGIEIKGNRITIQSNNFNLEKTGKVDATGKFSSKLTDSSGNVYESILGDAGLRINKNGSEEGRVTIGHIGNDRGVALQSTNAAVITNGKEVGYIFNPNGTVLYEQRNILQGGTRVRDDFIVKDLSFSDQSAKLYGTEYDGASAVVSSGGFYAYGSVGCSGTKYRIVETNNYGFVGMNAMETPAAFFADIGSGLVGEDGKCYVFVEDVFAETVDRNHDIYVQVTATNGREVMVMEKHQDYFVVSGETGTKFDWIIFAKQKNYEADRAERINLPKREIPYNDNIFTNDDIPAVVSEDYMNELNTDYDELAEIYLETYYKEVKP